MRIIQTNKMFLVAAYLEQASEVLPENDSDQVAQLHQQAFGYAQSILASGAWLSEWEDSWLHGVCDHVPRSPDEAKRQLLNKPMDN